MLCYAMLKFKFMRASLTSLVSFLYIQYGFHTQTHAKRERAKDPSHCTLKRRKSKPRKTKQNDNNNNNEEKNNRCANNNTTTAHREPNNFALLSLWPLLCAVCVCVSDATKWQCEAYSPSDCSLCSLHISTSYVVRFGLSQRTK